MKYSRLTKEVYRLENFKLVPIRMEDRYAIMKWRNEQLYHLRQSEPLTKEKQDDYFKNVVGKLFSQENPQQILFSFLQDDVCIAYGGLVHINWIDGNAEVSFVMNTELEGQYFTFFWKKYLSILEKVAFDDLGLHKLYVYAFDLRPHLYEMLESSNYFLDARLKNHCKIKGVFKDVVIYSKLNSKD